MVTTGKRPLIKAKLSPHSIIHSLKEQVKAHYVLSLTTDSDNFDKKINSEFKKNTRVQIANVYEQLRQNGFYISGLNVNGDLEFSQIVSNDGRLYDYDVFDRTLNEVGVKTPTKQEIQQMRLDCRKNFDKAYKKVNASIYVTAEDFNDVVF